MTVNHCSRIIKAISIYYKTKDIPLNNARRSNSIAFRVDATPQIGLGHFFRVDRLATMFLKHGWQVIIILKSAENLKFSDSRIEVIPVITENLEEQALEIKRICKGKIFQHLVFDISHFENVHNRRKDMLSVFQNLKDQIEYLHCIDDFIMFPFEFTTHFVPYWDAQFISFTKLSKTEYHLGLEFFVLYETEKVKVEEREFSKPLHWFICFGGSDSRRATVKALELVVRLETTEYSATVNIGKFFEKEHCIQIRNLAKTNHKIEIIESGNIQNEIRRSDLAFLSGGLTKYEACYHGVPQIIIPQFSEEEERMNSFSKAGTSLILDNVERFLFEQNLKRLKRLIQTPSSLIKMSAQGRKIVDGMGAQRMFQIISQQRIVN